MIRNAVSIGQYYPGDSLIHQLNPRIKIAFCVAFMSAAFGIETVSGILALSFLGSVAALFSRVPWRILLRGIRGLAFLFVVTVIAHAFFTAGEIIIRLGMISITTQGVINGIMMSVRLLIVVVATSLLTLTTSPARLIESMEHLMSPLGRVGFPAHELAMMMSISLRFIPTMAVEAEKLIKAQNARGAHFDAGNPMRRAQSWLSVLIPLFIMTMRRADELAMAMEARGYRGGEGRTIVNVDKIGWQSWLSLLVFVALLVLIITRLG